ncbi:GDP-L-fucose synthase family protein [Camelimonas abortus]|uniref:GDP-L-fucose synthase n=1 Tax=Camelimonas abortus TaxID=1017184 RepID=A0ABV7LC89_9HYPH
MDDCDFRRADNISAPGILDGFSAAWAGATIYVAGHRGLVGSALCRRLAALGCRVVTAERAVLDLRRQADVHEWMSACRPDAVIVAAATVGGIADNVRRPADYLADNLSISLNLLEAARVAGVRKLAFLGSSCIYPRAAMCPVREDPLLSGPLEPTNEAYAVAKIAGLKLAQAMRRQHGCDFISLMPTNLYGPCDRFDGERGHVIPALISRFEAARASGAAQCVAWGSGAAIREFLHVDDCADAILLALWRYSADAPLNIGSGEEISIASLAHVVADAVGYRGRIVFDRTRPDGAPRKTLDSTRIRALGWRPRIPLREGVRSVAAWRRAVSGPDVAAFAGGA